MDEISQVKELIESKINLSRTADREKRASLTTNKVMRICFIVGLSQTTERKEEDYKDIQLSATSVRIVPSFFTMHDLSTLYSALLKLRYANLNIDWSQNAVLSRIIAAEMLRGRDYLLSDNNLDSILYAVNNRIAMAKDCRCYRFGKDQPLGCIDAAIQGIVFRIAIPCKLPSFRL